MQLCWRVPFLTCHVVTEVSLSCQSNCKSIKLGKAADMLMWKWETEKGNRIPTWRFKVCLSSLCGTACWLNICKPSMKTGAGQILSRALIESAVYARCRRLLLAFADRECKISRSYNRGVQSISRNGRERNFWIGGKRSISINDALIFERDI